MRRWPAVVILALAPLWLVGTLDRGAWTPDEPREADIAWRMSQQSDRALPRLAGVPFLEKPPLSYWMSAAAVRIFGDSPAAARLPNLLYAALTALAIGALAFTMSGPEAAVIAAVTAPTALTSFRVAVWLAPDACLLAGCALALLGAYRGFIAPPGRRKLLGYVLMHTGAAIGFMAKSAPGWLVPALALPVVIVWERRWSELRRWELYAGLAVQAIVIGPWLYAVARSPQGADALVTLFWHNVIGRFTRISAPAALDYTTGHRNAPGKYWIELPVYLLPWSVLAVAAVRRAWRGIRIPGPARISWRFAVAATFPFLLLLSAAATGRDIYAAPALLGFGLLIGLWAADSAAPSSSQPTGRLDRLALRGTHVVVGFIAAALAAVLALLAFAGAMATPLGVAIAVGSATAIAAIALLALWIAIRLQGHATIGGELRAHVLIRVLAWDYIAYAAAIVLFGVAAFPTIDRWQDLPRLAREISDDSRGHELALWAPDETTIAMLDHPWRTPSHVLEPSSGTSFQILEPSSGGGTVETTIAGWFRAHGRSYVLVKLPGSGQGPGSSLLQHLQRANDTGDGIAAILVSEHIATVAHRYELPEGRRYALLACNGCLSLN